MVRCPSCGGSFTPPDGESPIVCPYCQANLDEAETRLRPFAAGLDSLGGSFNDDEHTQVEDRTRVDRPGAAPTRPAPTRPAPTRPPPTAEPEVGKRTMFGSPNPFSQDSISEQLPAAKPPEKPAPEKRTLFGRAAPGVPSSPRSAPAPAPARDDPAQAEKRRAERERYAAARLAAAAAVQKRRAATQRIRAALLLVLILGVAALIVAGVVLLTRNDFTAEIVGEPSVVRANDVYEVKVRVSASQTATVTHPGGQTAVEETAEIAFSVPESELSVGDNDIALTVATEGEAPVDLKLAVTVYYRLTSGTQKAPQEGRTVSAKLQLSPGWTAEVREGEVRPDGVNAYVLELDPEPLLDRVDSLKTPTGQLPVALTLRGPEGAVQAFTEQLELPLPKTPLTVWSPPPGRKTTGDTVRIAGRTSPGATVSAGGGYGRANGAGIFEVQASLPTVGSRKIEVRADGGRRAPSASAVTVERLDPQSWKATAKALSKSAQAWLGRAKRPPRWRDLAKKSERLRGRKVKLKGTLIAARRSASGGVEAQIDMCRGKARCPVWINLRAVPILSSAGERVTAYGTLDGTRDYTTTGGESMTVPVLDGHALVP